MEITARSRGREGDGKGLGSSGESRLLPPSWIEATPWEESAGVLPSSSFNLELYCLIDLQRLRLVLEYSVVILCVCYDQSRATSIPVSSDATLPVCRASCILWGGREAGLELQPLQSPGFPSATGKQSPLFPPSPRNPLCF